MGAEIFNATGELIHSSNRKTNNRVSLTIQSTGIYFIPLTSGKELYVGKVIKE
jgi:hypothetical protein